MEARHHGHDTSALWRSHRSFGEPGCATGILRYGLHDLYGEMPHGRTEKEMGRRVVAMIVDTTAMRAAWGVALAGFVLQRWSGVIANCVRVGFERA